MTTYEQYALERWHGCCQHCGRAVEAHHLDGRCYTPDELVSRLRFYADTGRWPEPDEGCDAATP